MLPHCRMSITEATLRDLRHRYNAAYTAYQSCVQALTEVTMSGKRPSPELLANEAKALHELTEARGKLLAALPEAQQNDGAVSVARPWRATKAPSHELIEIESQFSDLTDQDREHIVRLIDLAAEAPPTVQVEVRQRLTAPPKPVTQAELRGRVEAAIAYVVANRLTGTDRTD